MPFLIGVALALATCVFASLVGLAADGGARQGPVKLLRRRCGV